MERVALTIVLFLISCCALSVSVAVTPVNKVIQLLENLEKKVEAEGKEEAAAYDKYACFCKEELNDKLYAIETSNKKIAKLGDKINSLGSEISALDTDIGDLSGEIIRLTNKTADNKAARDNEHGTFLGEQADADAAIDAVERAITALDESKKALGGKAELEAVSGSMDLAQLRAVASAGMAMASHASMSADVMDKLVVLSKASQPGAAYTYNYGSNHIIGVLETLLMNFKNIKQRLEQDEYDQLTAYELLQQDLSNQKKFAIKEKTEKQALHASKSEEKDALQADKDKETSERDADKRFMDVFMPACKSKADLWDQRSQTRQGELTAIANALEALKTGAAPNFKANKKLVGIQKHVAVQRHTRLTKRAIQARPASFLQVQGRNLRGSSDESGAQVRAAAQAQKMLEDVARLWQSPVLSVVALKVVASQDHFVKVRQIIRDLIARLESDALAEADSKSFCDDEISKAVTRRDEQVEELEALNKQITAKQSDERRLTNEISALMKGIAKDQNAVREMTELRIAESAENSATVTDSDAGKAAVEMAIQYLTDFYESKALLQYTPWVAKGSDRQGLTVTDKSPEVFDSEYKGSQEASKGIIGMLEVILKDFDRTSTTVQGEEDDAVDSYTTANQTMVDEIVRKEGSVETKETALADIQSDLITLGDKKAGAETSHSEALDELSKLHSMCIAGVETYGGRVASRDKEIEALKRAHDILENWQK